MHFPTLALFLAATASAQYAITNGTSSAASTPASTSSAVAAPYPSASGTISIKPSGTGSVRPTSSTAPFEGAASKMTGSTLGLIVVGGVALML